jgi:hypothetical protein
VTIFYREGIGPRACYQNDHFQKPGFFFAGKIQQNPLLTLLPLSIIGWLFR